MIKPEVGGTYYSEYSDYTIKIIGISENNFVHYSVRRIKSVASGRMSLYEFNDRKYKQVFNKQEILDLIEKLEL